LKQQRWLGGDALAAGFGVSALALLVGFIGVSILSLVVWTASQGSWRAMTSPLAVDALLLSLRTTAASLAILLVIGNPAAYVLSRKDFPGKRIVDALVDIPIVLPPSAAGIALLLAFGREGLLGEHLQAFGITLSFTTAAVIMAELFVASPFYIRQAIVAFSSVSREVEDAARVDGAGRFGVFTRITIPITLPALTAGAVTAWARALGEFGATIIFAGSFQGVTQTLPLAIFEAQQSDFDAAVALSVMVLIFAFIVIFVSRFMTRRASEYSGW
jgi:molybdate transport system permease protein